MLLDPSGIEDVANAIWPLIAAGAAGAVGERGLNRATEQLDDVLGRLRRGRRERGLPDDPGTLDELRAELAALAALPEHASALQITYNTIHGGVVGETVVLGPMNTYNSELERER